MNEDHTPEAGAATSVPQANEIDLAAYRKEGRADALAYVNEVNQLCALAGCPGRAAEFLAAEMAVDDIRAALLESKAKADRADVDTHHEGLAPRSTGQHDILSETHQDTFARMRAQRKLA